MFTHVTLRIDLGQPISSYFLAEIYLVKVSTSLQINTVAWMWHFHVFINLETSIYYIVRTINLSLKIIYFGHNLLSCGHKIVYIEVTTY